MKKNTQKLLTLFMGVIALLISLPINTAKAAVVYPEYHPQDIINNESLYDEVIALTIEGNESELLPQIDFSKFSLLKEIFLTKTVVLDGAIINLDKPITSLRINDSIINLATTDLDDYNSIKLINVYIIGDKVESPKIHDNNPLNEEYKQNLNNIYGLQTYEEKINNIAKEIYSKSDGTNTDIIRLVTLYVLEHLEYDYNNSYTGLPFYESIIDQEKGVCVHYSDFESRLLNKLGIFAISIAGCTNLNNCMNTGHAWTAVYVNDNWYYIDPTWIDDDDSIEALKSKNYQSSAMVSSWYMIPINDPSSSYSTQRKPDFTMQDNIPIEYRVSKISILNEILPNNEESNEESNEENNNETLNPPSENDDIKAPSTGLFTSDNSFATVSIFATRLSIILLLTAMTNRIIRKIKIKNF